MSSQDTKEYFITISARVRARSYGDAERTMGIVVQDTINNHPDFLDEMAIEHIEENESE
jgi:hypothetical protein